MTTEEKKSLTRIMQRLTYLSVGVDYAIGELMKVRDQAHRDHREIFEKDGSSKRWLSQGAFAGDLDEAIEKASEVQDTFEEFLSKIYNIMLEEQERAK